MRYFVTLILSFLSTFIYSQDTNRRVDNMKTFAKLYGYVRHFHPSDEAASVDWEKFAIYGSNEVLNVTNDDELLKKLRELFSPVAPSVLIFKETSRQSFDVRKITPPDTNGYKTIAWQHSGLGIINLGVYKSIRINRPAPLYTMSGNASAPFTQFLDAKPLQGKEVRFSGWMKIELKEDEEGTGYFWLAVDTESGMGPYYTMKERPFATTEWREYSFTGKVTSKATRIGYGAKLTGKGKILVDDIKLQVKEGNEWKDIAIKNSSFENADKDGPADWDVQSIGFTRPGFDSSYSYTINTNDKHDGKSSFEVFSIENKASIKKGTIAKQLFDQHSNPGETIEKLISETLHATIPLALYGNEDHTYPIGDSISLRKLKININQFSKTANKGTDLILRLGDVVITWNIFKHFFPYWEDASKDAEVILTQALYKSMQNKTELDFKETLQLMTEPLNDGHIKVYLDGDVSEEFQPNILIDIAENKVVVDKVADTVLEKYIHRGDIIEEIDGRAVMQIVKEKENYISGSPQWKTSRVITSLLAGAENTEMILSLNRNGNTVDQTVVRRYNMIEYYNAADNERKKSGEMEEGIYYIDMAKLPADSLKKWANKLGAAKAVIFDLRGYPKGINPINYLLDENVQTKSMFVPRIIYPDYANVSFTEYGWNMKPEQPHFSGKIIFITDGRAISAAESVMGYIKDFKLATIIGGATAGTNGNINRFSLPGGYHIVWTGMLVKNHDGSKHHIRGIVPDVTVKRTIKGIKEGRDELLERAMELAEQQ